jgi:hypothetical protein
MDIECPSSGAVNTVNQVNPSRGAGAVATPSIRGARGGIVGARTGRGSGICAGRLSRHDAGNHALLLLGGKLSERLNKHILLGGHFDINLISGGGGGGRGWGGTLGDGFGIRSGTGRSARVGRHVTPEMRLQLVPDIAADVLASVSYEIGNG